MVYGLVKNNIESLRMMLNRCRQYHISLNLKKCIFCAPFGILLYYVDCRDGILMDRAKITIIVDLPPPMTIKKIRNTLGHMRYCRKFIRRYAEGTSPMDKLLKKYVKFQWNEQCQDSLDVLKDNMVTTHILVFTD